MKSTQDMVQWLRSASDSYEAELAITVYGNKAFIISVFSDISETWETIFDSDHMDYAIDINDLPYNDPITFIGEIKLMQELLKTINSNNEKETEL